MKFLTLLQPFASLLFTKADGYLIAKIFETRSWKTNHRGWLGITSSKRFTGDQAAWAAHFNLDECPTGCLMGFVKVIDCYRTDKMIWSNTGRYLVDVITVGQIRISTVEQKAGDFTPGRFAWHFDEQTSIPEMHSIETKGKQGLWKDDRLVERIKALGETHNNNKLLEILT